MNHIRLATQEEVESIKDTADLTPTCSVFALDTASGTDIAVLRQCYEVDPYYPAGGQMDGRRKAMFMFALESGMTMLGFDGYYFNISPSDETFRSVAEKWGAKQISKEPELRYKKSLR